MIIYSIIKLLLSYGLVFKKNWIKNQKNLYLMADLIIVIICLIIVSIKGIFIFTQMLLLGFIMLKLILKYKGINYIMENNEKILEKIKKYIGEKKQEKIKSFFLKPIVCKIIYYMIWLLPWNIGYWTYFWIIENGWYARVWITSTRDIIFWKIFKWDSRDFFYNLLYKKMKENKINYKIREKIWKIQEMIYRIMYFLYIIRKAILNINKDKYLFLTILAYIYILFIYIYLYIYIPILFLILIIIELLLFYYIKIIIKYYREELIFIMTKAEFTEEEIKKILFFLLYPFATPYMNKWVKNKFIWDETLGNSVSLNILYKYIIFVNKNTKGYFDKQMNIMTRIYREKYLERKSVLWDVLPRTRYVIISLRNEDFALSCSYVEKKMNIDFPFIKCNWGNLVTNSGLYLSYYEKTYSKTSLLMLIWMLRVNKNYWYSNFRFFYWDENLYAFHKLRSFFLIQKPVVEYIDILIYIYIFVYDKRLINDSMLFGHFLNRTKYFYNEEFYFYFNQENIVNARNELPISDKICGLEDYKKIFKIMGRIMLYEEDALVWNENLQKLLNEFNELKEKNEMIKNTYENVFKRIINNVNSNSMIFGDFEKSKELIKEFIEVNKEWFFDFEDFVLVISKVKEKKEKFEVIKTYLDDNNIKEEEILDFVYYLLIKEHKAFSEHKFYDKDKGWIEMKFNKEINMNEIEEYMKKFKKF